MDGARGGWAADRERELRRSLARLEGYRREALARDDQRQIAWAEDLIVRVEGLLGRLDLRRRGLAPPADGHPAGRSASG